MNQRTTDLVWLRDLLEHLASCRQRLEWSEDPETIDQLAESMLRDLERCRRLCEALRRRAGGRPAA